MSATHAHKSPLTPFDFFRVRSPCRACGHAEETHTVRTWWNAPNRTAGWDAPSTSGTTYELGAQPARLSLKHTRYRGESRCMHCDTVLKWWIVAERGRVAAIHQVSVQTELRLVARHS